MPEDRRARLRRQKKAERERVWDPGGVGEDGREIKPRWRLIHPGPYGGHGSSTASSVCGCQCRQCLATAAAARRERARNAKPAARAPRTRWERQYR